MPRQNLPLQIMTTDTSAPERLFRFRLRSQPADTGNPASTAVVERLGDDGVWEHQIPSLETPPFRLSLIALLLCLLYHLVSEARERELPLRTVAAELDVSVRPDWDLRRIDGRFQVTTGSGAKGPPPFDAAAVEAMLHRMRRSPVARNLPATVPLAIELELLS